MCMIFHIGAREQLRVIPFQGSCPDFHTAEFIAADNNIRNHISLPHILYFATAEGCGCNFRHALLSEGVWWNVEDEDEEFKMENQTNHLCLYEYIRLNVTKGSTIEIYSCWDGNLNEVCLSKEKISLDTILDEDFYFKEQGLYVIEI